MRRRGGEWAWPHVGIALVAASCAGGSCGGCHGCDGCNDCTCGGLSPSESREVTIDGVDIDVEAHATTDRGGILQGCQVQGYGVKFMIDVEDRGAVFVGSRKTPEEADDDELDAMLPAVTVRLAKNHQHVAGELDGTWRAYHLLEGGPPFKSHRTEWTGAAPPDLDTFPSAIDVALANLKDDAWWAGDNMWLAFERSPPHEPLDLAMLKRWPASSGNDHVQRAVLARADKGSGVSAKWRVEARVKGMNTIRTDETKVLQAGEVVVALDGGTARKDVLDHALTQWPDGNAHAFLVLHVADAPGGFKGRLAAKAKTSTGGSKACEATIMLAYLDPTSTTCADVDAACDAFGERISGSCEPKR